MLARYFEDLEIWKEARRLTREIYRLTSGSQFSKDFNLVAKSKAPPFLSCQTSQKGSSMVAIRSSDSSFTSQKAPVVKCVRNCM